MFRCYEFLEDYVHMGSMAHVYMDSMVNQTEGGKGSSCRRSGGVVCSDGSVVRGHVHMGPMGSQTEGEAEVQQQMAC